LTCFSEFSPFPASQIHQLLYLCAAKLKYNSSDLFFANYLINEIIFGSK
jgi:hypothetical protein